ncbi:MAG: hypothetical protein Q8L48_03665 [Archangium sp.]|nr:hypothetical protein [Archangium sp.]
MLTLLLALAVSQATVTDEALPPPPPVEEPARVEVSTPPMLSAPGPAPQPGVPYKPSRSATLLEPQPQVSAGALVGRVGMALAIGFAGRLTAEFVALGFVYLGLSAGGSFGLVAIIVGGLLSIGITFVAVALGSALFGNDFGRDFQEAMPVAAIAVGSAVLIGFVLTLLFIPPLLAVGVPLIIAAVATPLIVQVRKPSPSEVTMKDAVPMRGVTALAF